MNDFIFRRHRIAPRSNHRNPKGVNTLKKCIFKQTPQYSLNQLGPRTLLLCSLFRRLLRGLFCRWLGHLFRSLFRWLLGRRLRRCRQNPLRFTDSRQPYLLPVLRGTNGHRSHVHIGEVRLVQHFREELHVHGEALDDGEIEEQLDGEVALRIHVGTEELVDAEVFLGKDELAGFQYEKITYSFGSMLRLEINLPSSVL